jgi:hypothetical protein
MQFTTLFVTLSALSATATAYAPHYNYSVNNVTGIAQGTGYTNPTGSLPTGSATQSLTGGVHPTPTIPPFVSGAAPTGFSTGAFGLLVAVGGIALVSQLSTHS